jgi:hypothetical protein
VSTGFVGSNSVILGDPEREGVVVAGFTGSFFSFSFSGVGEFGFSDRATRRRVAGSSRKRDEARRFSGTIEPIRACFGIMKSSRKRRDKLKPIPLLFEGWVDGGGGLSRWKDRCAADMKVAEGEHPNFEPSW